MAESIHEPPENEPLDFLSEYAFLYDACRDAMQHACLPNGPALARIGQLGSICIVAGYSYFGEGDRRILTLIDSQTTANGYQRIIKVSGGFGDEPGPHEEVLALSEETYRNLDRTGIADEDVAQAFAEQLEDCRYALRETSFDPLITRAALEKYAPTYVGSQRLTVPIAGLE